MREALHRLEAGGLIERIPRRGYVVNQLDLRGVEELYEVRLALELLVVERLCERGIPDSTLGELRQVWRAVLKKPPDTHEELAELDRQFHETLAGAIENQIMLNDLRSINDRISIIRVLDFEIDQRTEGTCKQHLAILDRISKGDVEGARRAMRVNVEDGCNNVKGILKEALAKAHGMNARRLQ